MAMSLLCMARAGATIHLVTKTSRGANSRKISLTSRLFDQAKDGSGSNSSSSGSSSSSSSSSDEDHDRKPVNKLNPNEAKEKLDSLLMSIKQKKVSELNEKKQIDLVKPKPTSRKKRLPLNTEDIDPDLAIAARSVGKHIGGGDEETARKAESELLNRLRTVAKDSLENRERGKLPEADNNMKSLLDSLKVESSSKSKPLRAPLTEEQKNFIEKRKMLRRERREETDYDERLTHVNLYSAKPLGIFTKEDLKGPDNADEAVLATWNECQKRELKILSTPIPKNFLDEMVQMTDRGILWKFPIDNEQGIEEEKLEPFFEHVFLEPHLEPWCPPRGPVRHFMELVCIGLQKNPHITVKQKVEHIEWFKNYFEDEEKSEILKLSGAVEGDL